MTRRLNRFHRPSLDFRRWLSTVASLKLATARAGRFAAIVLTATATLLLAGIGTAPAHAATRLTISPLVLVFPQQEVGTTSTAKNVTLTNPNASAPQINTVTPSGDFSLSRAMDAPALCSRPPQTASSASSSLQARPVPAREP